MLLEISNNSTLVVVGGSALGILIIALGFMLMRLITSNDKNFQELFRKHAELTTTNNTQNTNIAVLNANFETHMKSDEKMFAEINRKLEKVA